MSASGTTPSGLPRPEPRELGLETALQLLDFSGGQDQGQQAWASQLQGAVALHNVLVRERVAYLADEVGMGKTYVALGAAALFRHFQPDWRVLYIAPRENIQLKWRKELLNFTRHNWRVSDNRVRTYAGTPAYGLAVCGNLLELAREAALNPNRDFLLRLSSFSFGLSKGDDSQWKRKRAELLDELPLLNKDAFDLRDKDGFKDSYARAINAVLPHFDLVIFDEGHNLKHGLRAGGAARNRLLSLVLGHPTGKDPNFPHYGRRFGRVLLLSATPLESDYQDLWNQLDVFGLGRAWEVLRATDDDETAESAKQAAAERFLIRRLTTLTIGGQPYTKNMYRREWRQGGVDAYDLPLAVPGERQRLIVGLVQKKVAEVLQDTRFNHAFQIGMLASFESFLETAQVAAGEREGVFDDADQAEDDLEKDGIDTQSLNDLARSYRKTFHAAMPHPKMDALAERLKESFVTGRKALVFARRVRSVDELAEKLNRHYDAWLRARLMEQLPPAMHADLAQAFDLHQADRERRRRVEPPISQTPTTGDEAIVEAVEPLTQKLDPGGVDNFFTWWFRGDRAPKQLFSGAAFKRNRLDGEGSPYSLMFEDNYVRRLLGPATDLVQALADQAGLVRERVAEELRSRAWGFWTSRQKEFRRRPVYFAYQKAALAWLAEHAAAPELRTQAQIMCQERFDPAPPRTDPVPDNFPTPDDRLGAVTFFTELDQRPSLGAVLWPTEVLPDFRATFRRREQRRELLASVATLGHPFIDLWTLAVKRVGSLQAGQEDASEQPVAGLIADYLDLLAGQQAIGESGAYLELAEVARHFDLILAVNFPGVTELPLSALTRLFGSSLGEQNPVGGMWGQVNRTMITQFRMPGYPRVLITTDLLQEGEDLHTFCASVYHYGIAWTPSSLEQRTGRIDRLHSLAHRRLDNQPTAEPGERLQVYYPHLRETVEVLQVERVYERMNRFIRMLHRSLVGEALPSSRIDTRHEFALPVRDIQPITEQLTTIFPVRAEWLHTEWPAESTGAGQAAANALDHCKELVDQVAQRYLVKFETQRDAWTYVGTAYVRSDKGLVLAGLEPGTARQQPFRLGLWVYSEAGQLLVRCTSPIGQLEQSDTDLVEQIMKAQQRLGFAKVSAVPDDRQRTFHLAAEADLLFDPRTTQVEEIQDLLARTLFAADQLEQVLTSADAPLDAFRAGLLGEGADHG